MTEEPDSERRAELRALFRRYLEGQVDVQVMANTMVEVATAAGESIMGVAVSDVENTEEEIERLHEQLAEHVMAELARRHPTAPPP